MEEDRRLIQIVLSSLSPTDKLPKHVNMTMYKMRTWARYFTSDRGNALPIRYQLPLATNSCLPSVGIGVIISRVSCSESAIIPDRTWCTDPSFPLSLAFILR